MSTKAVKHSEMLASGRQRGIMREIRKNWVLYLMIIPTLIYVFIFNYIPMYGVLMAFQNYMPTKGVIGSEWVGLDHFKRYLSMPMFTVVLKNTLTLSIYSLVAGFPMPVILAISMNYMRNLKFKKLVQTVTYAPHFISTVVMVSMVMIFFSSNPNTGIVNFFITKLGGEPIFFMAEPAAFKHMYVWSGVWQGVGWSSIIYMAALAGIDPTLYESATIDGATLVRKIIHIDIPCIAPTIIILLIMSCGGIMGVGFEKVYLMQNNLNVDASEVISTYVYKRGLIGGEYSFSTAVGLFNSLVNIILLTIVNTIAGKVGETKLW